MADETIAGLAQALSRSPEVLLEQLRAAGAQKTTISDLVSDADKQLLLDYLKGSHRLKPLPGENMTTFAKRTTAEISQVGTKGWARTIQVEVKKRRTFVQPEVRAKARPRPPEKHDWSWMDRRPLALATSPVDQAELARRQSEVKKIAQERAQWRFFQGLDSPTELFRESGETGLYRLHQTYTIKDYYVGSGVAEWPINESMSLPTLIDALCGCVSKDLNQEAEWQKTFLDDYIEIFGEAPGVVDEEAVAEYWDFSETLLIYEIVRGEDDKRIFKLTIPFDLRSGVFLREKHYTDFGSELSGAEGEINEKIAKSIR